MADDPLDDFDAEDVTLYGTTRRVHRLGSGPAVIVIAEIRSGRIPPTNNPTITVGRVTSIDCSPTAFVNAANSAKAASAAEPRRNPRRA